MNVLFTILSRTDLRDRGMDGPYGTVCYNLEQSETFWDCTLLQYYIECCKKVEFQLGDGHMDRD